MFEFWSTSTLKEIMKAHTREPDDRNASQWKGKRKREREKQRMENQYSPQRQNMSKMNSENSTCSKPSQIRCEASFVAASIGGLDRFYYNCTIFERQLMKFIESIEHFKFVFFVRATYLNFFFNIWIETPFIHWARSKWKLKMDNLFQFGLNGF